MPSYAILGATGQTGSEILSLLLKQRDTSVRALVRSRSKLERQLDGKTPSNLTIYEGVPSDIDLLTKCIANTRAVFIGLGPVGNQPNCTIVQDAISSLISALHDLSMTQQLSSQTPSRPLPHIILLSSASTEPTLSADLPRLAHAILLTGAAHIYADVMAAERILRAQSSWISSTFIKPGGLVHDVPRGHVLATDRQQTFTSFADLAAGMVEVAERGGEEWGGRFVSVVPKPGTKAKIAWEAPLGILLGMVVYYLPWTYRWLS